MTGQGPEWAEWPTANDLAERWKCSPETVRRYRKEGKLQGVLVFKSWRFDPETVATCESSIYRQGLER